MSALVHVDITKADYDLSHSFATFILRHFLHFVIRGNFQRKKTSLIGQKRVGGQSHVKKNLDEFIFGLDFRLSLNPRFCFVSPCPDDIFRSRESISLGEQTGNPSVPVYSRDFVQYCLSPWLFQLPRIRAGMVLEYTSFSCVIL